MTLSRRTFAFGLAGCAISSLGGCVTGGYQTAGPTTDLVQRGYRPDLNTDEAGVWLTAEKNEKLLRTSATRIRNPEVNALVADMMCRLVGEYCPDLRTYVVRQPIFNAFCSPNGMVQVCTGLLLRCNSESQLAAVLGHEFGHYLHRHTMQRIRDDREWQAWTNAMIVLGNSPNVQVLRHNILQLRRMSYSRDNERESDEVGFRLMVKAGYDPKAAATIWKNVAEERDAGDIDDDFDAFTATHPPTDERIETLTELAKQAKDQGRGASDRLADAIAPIRGMMMADEINLGHFKQTETVFNRLIHAGRDVGEVLYYKGELYRRRGKDGDEAMALGFYHEACEAPGAPPEALRSVGLMRWRRGEKEQAREYFQRYLAVKPDADDRAMIQSYLVGA
ncbi:M48 family metalloprotease [Magnetospirillum aberrantis]|uniref:M48 family metalloprotease n=1 Tax=Magnetospirillum aberrantis SpK TaxID=908842 RepID=A0A7C9UWS5_9PROT|nr:M48 family metalloprotease [Magnetospirillum aberrantis]NFV80590.1 M48 family metalloprotease [Magnetospirillum aberrantis SpK]